MEGTRDRDARGPADRRMDRGEEEIVAAILLVAERRVPSVVISNLPDSDTLVASLESMAAGVGVAMDRLARLDGSGHDVRIHLIGSGRVGR